MAIGKMELLMYGSDKQRVVGHIIEQMLNYGKAKLEPFFIRELKYLDERCEHLGPLLSKIVLYNDSSRLVLSDLAEEHNLGHLAQFLRQNTLTLLGVAQS